MLRIALEGGLVSVSLMMIYHKRHIAVFMAFQGEALSPPPEIYEEKKNRTAESRRRNPAVLNSL